MTVYRRHLLRELKEYLSIIVAVTLYSVGVTIFFLPYGLTAGGVTGVATIIYFATGLEIQNTYMFINVILLLVAIKVLGWRFCAKTIVATITITFTLWLFQRIIEVPDPLHPGEMMLPKLVGDQSFMAAVLGSIINGVGLAICFENHGSTGGTDIVAAIINKYKPVSLGTTLRLCDICIVSSCYFVFHDWSKVIFGFVILFICSVTLDFTMRRRHQSTQFLIFSRNYRAIANAINDSGHGATILDGTGWYTKSERKVIVAMVHNRDADLILQIVRRIDPYSMVSQTDIIGYGESFGTIQARQNKERRIIICATNNESKLLTARTALPNDFDVRSLFDAGCDTREKFYAPALNPNPTERVSFIKRYFGFDTFYMDQEGVITLAEGSPSLKEQKIIQFPNIEAMVKYITEHETTETKDTGD